MVKSVVNSIQRNILCMIFLCSSQLVGMENKHYRAVFVTPSQAPGADKLVYPVIIYQKGDDIPENIRNFEKAINGAWWDRTGKNILWIRFSDYSIEKMEPLLCKF